MKRWLRGWIRWLALGILILEVSMHTPLRHIFPLNALALLHPWWYVPTLLALPYLMLQRRWPWFAIWSMLALIWLVTYLPRWFPSPSEPIPGAISLRVLTWNVWGGNTDAAGILAAIEREQPDLVLLQEVDENLRNPLAARLRFRYPFYEIRLPTEPGLQPSDLAVFSRYPYTVSALDCPYWQCYRRTLELDLGSLQTTVVNVHIERSAQREVRLGRLPIPFSLNTTREQQVVAQLVTSLSTTQPLIMAGDFNLTEEQGPGLYNELAAVWQDSWRQAGRGMGFTWPQTLLTFPLIRIDYVWHSADWRTVHAHTGSGTSDHRYLVVDLQYP